MSFSKDVEKSLSKEILSLFVKAEIIDLNGILPCNCLPDKDVCLSISLNIKLFLCLTQYFVYVIIIKKEVIKIYYDDYDVVQCAQCGHVQYATTSSCLMCGGKLLPADEETSNRIKAESKEICNNAAQKQINAILDDIGKGRYRQENQHTPRCPICQSPNIKQISVAKRAVHGYAFGLFSNTARSQWECLNCGHKF